MPSEISVFFTKFRNSPDFLYREDGISLNRLLYLHPEINIDIINGKVWNRYQCELRNFEKFAAAYRAFIFEPDIYGAAFGAHICLFVV